MNETMTAIMNRKSVRAYTDREISPECREQILRAAAAAPTAGNQQLYTILDITSQELKEKHNPDGTGGCVKKYLWNSKNFDIMGTETPEPGERQEDKCT